MKNILVCICGSIAAYKAINVISKLVQKGFNVEVALSHHAKQFVSKTVIESLTKNQVYDDLFSKPLAHIDLGVKADLVVVMPATYNIIGKVSAGIADDLITTIISATTKKVIFALAMNDNMYSNPIFKRNLANLGDLKYDFIMADEGFLACNKQGQGRLKAEEEILAVIYETIEHENTKENTGDLKNKKIVITAGSTKEYIDPIRYLSSNSSGKMGWYLAKECQKRGAEVVLIIGQNNLEKIDGIKTLEVTSADEMYNTLAGEYETCDILIGSAAVSDYRVKNIAEHKIKKIEGINNLALELIENKDILKEFGKNKGSRIFAGFCLETENIKENALQKLRSKNLDFIVANTPRSLSNEDGNFYIIDNNKTAEYENTSKINIAKVIINKVAQIILANK